MRNLLISQLVWGCAVGWWNCCWVFVFSWEWSRRRKTVSKAIMKSLLTNNNVHNVQQVWLSILSEVSHDQRPLVPVRHHFWSTRLPLRMKHSFSYYDLGKDIAKPESVQLLVEKHEKTINDALLLDGLN